MQLQKMMLEYLFNDKTKDEIIKALNDKVDIPIINEKTEAKILESIYETIESVMKSVLLK
tara:strand:- start:305 stop:484 length:180 start_codon:yes stop_codon:yes gene_type:complete